MGFAAPWLWALMAGVAVPVFIHLARRPHETGRAVASLMFLKRHEVRQTRARTLRDRALLLARMLVLACLVLALAEPYVERLIATNDRPQATVIIVDQSASMQAAGRSAEAQRVFNQLLGGLETTTTPVAMLGATGTSRQLLDFTTDTDALRAAFNSAAPLPVKGRLRPALQHAADLLDEAEFRAGRIVLISDLQRSAMPASEGPFSLGTHTLEVLAVGETVPANLTLSSMRWQGDNNRVGVWVTQNGAAVSTTGRLQVRIDEHVALDEAIELEAGEAKVFHVAVTPAADRVVEVSAQLTDGPYAYDNRAGIIIGAERALQFRAGFGADPPKQLVAALSSFRSPRMRDVSAGARSGGRPDLHLQAGGANTSFPVDARAVIAFGGRTASGGGASLVAIHETAHNPLGQFDVSSLAPELTPLADSIRTLDIPGAQALQRQSGDNILMRWASGEPAVILRRDGDRQGLTVGIGEGAALDTLGRSRVFAPLLRQWVLRVVGTDALAQNYAPGELILRADATPSRAGGVIVSPDGGQRRWQATSPLFAPRAPGRYEVVMDQASEQQSTWAFWVRHDASEANLTNMPSDSFLARGQQVPSANKSTRHTAPSLAPSRVAWWRAALVLVILLTLVELRLATRAAALEGGVN